LRILLAPDKFKGTFAAIQVCRLLARGIRDVDPSIEVVSSPMADGGEGTLDVALAALGGARLSMACTGPLSDPLTAEVGSLPDGRLLVESARICGLLTLEPGRRDPLRSTTFGLGKALLELIPRWPSGVMVGLGGSATVDGGLGLARALGYRLRGPGNSELRGVGRDLGELKGIDPPESPLSCPVPPRVLVDVLNPLVGSAGAARSFASQKGAGPREVKILERGLERLARILERDMGVAVAGLPGGGAAGGLGAALHAFLGAPLEPGADAMARMTGLRDALDRVDLVVTGEGAYETGHMGKVADLLLSLAKERGLPAVIVCGRFRGDPPEGRCLVLPHQGLIGERGLVEAGRSLVLSGFWRK
jgi:glycerate kinase